MEFNIVSPESCIFRKCRQFRWLSFFAAKALWCFLSENPLQVSVLQPAQTKYSMYASLYIANLKMLTTVVVLVITVKAQECEMNCRVMMDETVR